MQKLIKFRVEEKYPSLNRWYAGSHWRNRAKLKNHWLEIFGKQIRSVDVTDVASFEIDLLFNNGYDVDNNITIIKLFADALVKEKVVANDNKKYWRDCAIHFDPSIPKGEAIIYFYYKPTITEI